MLIRAIFAESLALSIFGAVRAEDASGCGKFKWSVARQLAWIAAGPAPVASGAGVGWADKAYAVALVPSEAAGFAIPPERPLKPGTNAATLEVAAPGAPGAYDVTLSDEAWIDVVQGGARLKSSDFSGQKDCAGVRKVVRFDLAGAPATVEISDASATSILFSIAPAQP